MNGCVSSCVYMCVCKYSFTVSQAIMSARPFRGRLTGGEMFKLITKEEKGRRGDGMRKWERGRSWSC